MTTPLRLNGGPNFRALGGCDTTDDRRVRPGLVFRSGDSTTLTASDLELVKQLQPKMVVDLRSNKACAAYPARWPLGANTELIEANIMADMRSGQLDIMAPLKTSPNAAGAREMMQLTYRTLPEACGPAFGDMVRKLAQCGQAPAIFHCTYGRDRTGFFAAMLLHILNVPRNVIAADYLKSNNHIFLVATKSLTRSILKSLADIEAAWQSRDDNYGGADAYLESVGVNTTIKASLRKLLLKN